jgi:Serpin (serine protease inhibitor)
MKAATAAVLGASFIAACLLSGDGRAAAAAASPAADRMPSAARLLDGDRAADVISPAGVASALCSIAPATTGQAQRQLTAASGIDCARFSAFSPAAIWLPSGPAYDAAAIRDLRAHAEVFEDRPPFNAAVAAWTARRGGIPVHFAQPVVFAAVSVLDYSATWQFPVLRSDVRPGTFHGRDRSTNVTFISGIGAGLQSDGGCERTTIRLAYRGALRLSKIAAGGLAAAQRCLSKDYRNWRDVRYTVPRIATSGQSDLTLRLKRLGVTDIFTRAKNPFERLQRGLALSAVLQAAAFRLDETGVGIRATTAADTELGIPHPKAAVTFDVPFAFVVLDGKGTPEAAGVINDL